MTHFSKCTHQKATYKECYVWFVTILFPFTETSSGNKNIERLETLLQPNYDATHFRASII